jgi:hypothetical protein
MDKKHVTPLSMDKNSQPMSVWTKYARKKKREKLCIVSIQAT